MAHEAFGETEEGFRDLRDSLEARYKATPFWRRRERNQLRRHYISVQAMLLVPYGLKTVWGVEIASQRLLPPAGGASPNAYTPHAACGTAVRTSSCVVGMGVDASLLPVRPVHHARPFVVVLAASPAGQCHGHLLVRIGTIIIGWTHMGERWGPPAPIPTRPIYTAALADYPIWMV
jgi:hypothetical protein